MLAERYEAETAASSDFCYHIAILTRQSSYPCTIVVLLVRILAGVARGGLRA